MRQKVFCPLETSRTPSSFIPIAEDLGLINPIGERVTGKACRQAAEWTGDARLAVNISPVPFRNGQLVRTVAEALDACGFAPGRLELEITESVALRDDDATVSKLHELHRAGPVMPGRGPPSPARRGVQGVASGGHAAAGFATRL